MDSVVIVALGFILFFAFSLWLVLTPLHSVLKYFSVSNARLSWAAQVLTPFSWTSMAEWPPEVAKFAGGAASIPIIFMFLLFPWLYLLALFNIFFMPPNAWQPGDSAWVGPTAAFGTFYYFSCWAAVRNGTWKKLPLPAPGDVLSRCPHCHTFNRVAEKDEASAACGQCHQAFFGSGRAIIWPALAMGALIALTWVAHVIPAGANATPPRLVFLWSAGAALACLILPAVVQCERRIGGGRLIDTDVLKDLRIFFTVMAACAIVFEIANLALVTLALDKAYTITRILHLQKQVEGLAKTVEALDLSFLLTAAVIFIGWMLLRFGRPAWLERVLKTHRRVKVVKTYFTAAAIGIGAFALSGPLVAHGALNQLADRFGFVLPKAEDEKQLAADVDSLLTYKPVEDALAARPEPELDCGAGAGLAADCPADIAAALEQQVELAHGYQKVWPSPEPWAGGFPAAAPGADVTGAAEKALADLASRGSPSGADAAVVAGLGAQPPQGVKAAMDAARELVTAEPGPAGESSEIPKAWADTTADFVLEQAQEIFKHIRDAMLPHAAPAGGELIKHMADLLSDATQSHYQEALKETVAEIVTKCVAAGSSCKLETVKIVQKARHRREVTERARLIAAIAAPRLIRWKTTLAGIRRANAESLAHLRTYAEVAIRNERLGPLAEFRDQIRQGKVKLPEPDDSRLDRLGASMRDGMLFSQTEAIVGEWDDGVLFAAVKLTAKGSMSQDDWDRAFLEFLNDRPSRASLFATALQSAPETADAILGPTGKKRSIPDIYKALVRYACHGAACFALETRATEATQSPTFQQQIAGAHPPPKVPDPPPEPPRPPMEMHGY